MDVVYYLWMYYQVYLRFCNIKINPITDSGMGVNYIEIRGKTIADNQQVNFNGSIEGKNNNTILKGIKVNKVESGQYGLFGYSKNLEVKNLRVSYSDENQIIADKDGGNFGGIVANNCGNLKIDNCKINVWLNAYHVTYISMEQWTKSIMKF